MVMLYRLAVALMPLMMASLASAQTAAPPQRDKFVEQGADQIGSPFTKATVLKLNAIVRKSQAIIAEFDRTIPGIRKSVAAGAARGATAAQRTRAKASFASLTTLAGRAQFNRADMQRAERQLRASGEKYNDTILAAMVEFCVEVDTELQTEQRALAAKLKGR